MQTHTDTAASQSKLCFIDTLTDSNLATLENVVSLQGSLNPIVVGNIHLSKTGLARFSHLNQSDKPAANTNHLSDELSPLWNNYIDLASLRKFKKANSYLAEACRSNKSMNDIGKSILNKLYTDDAINNEKKNQLLKIFQQSDQFSQDIYAMAAHWAFYYANTDDHFKVSQQLYKKILVANKKTIVTEDYYIWRNYLMTFPLSYTNKRYLQNLARQWQKLMCLNPHDPLGWEVAGNIYLCLNEIENKKAYQQKGSNCYQQALTILADYPDNLGTEVQHNLCGKLLAYSSSSSIIQEKIDHLLKKKCAFGTIIHQQFNDLRLNFQAPDPKNDFPNAGGCGGGSCGGCGCGCSSGIATESSRSQNLYFFKLKLDDLLNHSQK